MATESPMGMLESSRVRKRPSSKDAAAFGFPLKNMAAEQSGVLLKGQRFLGDQVDIVPNRSGSAPPSMEGSFASIKNLLMQHNSCLNSSLANLSSAIENGVLEQQLRSDPAYFAYYSSNINLNPRLPPPLISQKNQRLVHQMGFFGNNLRLTSVDDSGNGSLHLSQGSLSTYKEESEDGTSPRPASNNLAESSTALMPGQNTVSLPSRHKSLVDLIQEDFPRTPSPVYNQSRSSGHATTEGSYDSDVSSIDASKLLESNTGSTDLCSEACALDARAIGLISDSNPSLTSFTSSRCPDGRGSPPMPEYNESNNNDAGLKDDASFSGALGSDVSGMDTKTRASNAESDRKKQEERLSYKRNMAQQHSSAQRGIPHQVQGFQAQVSSQGMNHFHGVMEKVPHGHPNFFSLGMQPSLHSPGLIPPLYATMTSGHPYYPTFYPSGLFSPQYSVGGYALSSVHLPSYMAAYPSHGAIPLPFDPTSAPSFSGQTAGASTGEGIPLVGDVQHLRKFYGQHGFMLQPTFVDPHQMLYYPHPFDNAYSTAFHSRLASTGVIGGQDNPFALLKESTVASYMSDQKLQPPTNGSLSILSPRKAGNTSGSYFPSTPNLDVMTQFPASPLPSSLLPSSPVGGMRHLGRHSEMRLPQSSIRNSGLYSGWQGQRGLSSFDEPKRHSLLEELKSSNARKFDLSAIAGRIVEFSVDQHGSRFIQQKLEHCSVEDKASVFKEVLPHASPLMIDVFGNYVIQKFFEYGSREQRKELADQLAGQMLPLSLQMYGCRVIQKHVLKMGKPHARSQIIKNFIGAVVRMSLHKYASNVVEKCLEHGDTTERELLIEEIIGQSEDNDNLSTMMKDQFANYVVQKILEKSNEKQREILLSRIRVHLHALKKYTYGKHIVARFEQLSGEETQPLE